MLFQEKKAPARNAPHRRAEWAWSPQYKCPDIQLPRYLAIWLSGYPDVQRYQISVISYQKKIQITKHVFFHKGKDKFQQTACALCQASECNCTMPEQGARQSAQDAHNSPHALGLPRCSPRARRYLRRGLPPTGCSHCGCEVLAAFVMSLSVKT